MAKRSFITRLRQAFSAPKRGERKSTADTLELFKQVFGTTATTTGESVSYKSALELAVGLACTRVIANGISQVPLKLLRESADGRTRDAAKDHPLHWVLFRRPNPWQTSFEYRQTIALHLVLCGNHYSFKNVVDGRVVELIPFEPGAVSVDRAENGDLTYTVRAPNGKEQVYPADAIWHIRGMSWNGWMGLETVKLAREAIGLTVATEKQQGRLFSNGVNASGVYSVEGELDKEQYEALRDWIVANTSGEMAGSPLILDRAAKWAQTTMTSLDAQHLETRRMQIEEVCRAFGVLPIMVGHSDKVATYASAEQMFIAHVVHSLAPWYECIEQSIACQLLSDADVRAGYYAKFIEEGLMRGSAQETSEVLLGYTNGGLMTPNEARAKLDMNPDPDPASDALRIPANIVGKDDGDDESDGVAAPVEQEPAPQIDVASIAQAIAQAIAGINLPAPIVNVAAPLPTPPAPQTITVESPTINVNVPEQPAANVTVEAPHVNVAPPSVTVEAPNVSVTVEKAGKLRFVEDANGTLTGAELE